MIHSNCLFLCLQVLTVTQIKKVRLAIDDHMKQNDASLLQHESDRNEALKEIGNMLHTSCIISKDEV